MGGGVLARRALMMDGARKSLEPMVTRMGGTAWSTSRCSSSWPIRRGIRLCSSGRSLSGCARRSADGVGARRYRVPEGRQAFAGGQASVFGDVGEGRELSDRGVGARGREAWDGAVGVGAVSARGVVCGSGAASEAKIPEQVVFKTKPELGVSWSSGRRAGGSARRRCSATRPTATTPRCGPGSHESGMRLRARGRPADEGVCRPRRSSPFPERSGGHGPAAESAAARSRPRGDQRAAREARPRAGADGRFPRRA